MNIDELIKLSLNKAASEMEVSKEEKTDMLLNVLTEFLKSQIKEDKDKNN